MESLGTLFYDMGFMRYPLAFTVLVIFALTSYSTVQLYKPGAWADLRTKTFLDGILFWGVFATITGVLGSLIGIVIAAQAIERAGAVSGPLIAGGFKVAMLTSIFGVLILGAASLTWYGLQLRWRLLEAKAANENGD